MKIEGCVFDLHGRGGPWRDGRRLPGQRVQHADRMDQVQPLAAPARGPVCASMRSPWATLSARSAPAGSAGTALGAGIRAPRGHRAAGSAAHRLPVARPDSPPRAPSGGGAGKARPDWRASWGRLAPSGECDALGRHARRIPGSGTLDRAAAAPAAEPAGWSESVPRPPARAPRASWRITMRLASQVSRCDVPAGTCVPSSSTDCPAPAETPSSRSARTSAST